MSYRAIVSREIATFADLFGRAFRYEPASYIEQLTAEPTRYSYSDCHVWENESGEIVAGLAAFQRLMSLHGGELMADLIAIVGVPPEHRRRGYATAMMTALLKESYARQIPFSLLFATSIPFYNRLGYGVVNYSWLLEFPLKALSDFDELRLIRRMTPEDLPAMRQLYNRERLRHNGWLSRTDWEWHERVFDLSGQAEWPHKVEGVVVPGQDDEILGYLTYTLAFADRSKDRVLSIQEWVNDSLRDDAWRALAGFVAAQRAQADFLRYTAPVGFPLLHALGERSTFRDQRQTEFAYRDTLSYNAGLMGRIVHLKEALRQRSYPASVAGECIVVMNDSHLPANSQPLHFHIQDGEPTVSAPTAQNNLTEQAIADVRTWTELYASALSPTDARRLGRLKADEATIRFLTDAFAGSPWYIHRADWF